MTLPVRPDFVYRCAKSCWQATQSVYQFHYNDCRGRCPSLVLSGTGLRYRMVEGLVVIETAPVRGTVTGRVFDTDGDRALVGVSVSIRGTNVVTLPMKLVSSLYLFLKLALHWYSAMWAIRVRKYGLPLLLRTSKWCCSLIPVHLVR